MNLYSFFPALGSAGDDAELHDAVVYELNELPETVLDNPAELADTLDFVRELPADCSAEAERGLDPLADVSHEGVEPFLRWP